MRFWMQIHRSPTLPLQRVGCMPLHQTPFKITLKIIIWQDILNATHFLKNLNIQERRVCRLALQFRVKDVTQWTRSLFKKGSCSSGDSHKVFLRTLPELFLNFTRRRKRPESRDSLVICWRGAAGVCVLSAAGGSIWLYDRFTRSIRENKLATKR